MSIWSMLSVWPQWWQVGGIREKICDFVSLVWPIRNRVITTSSALVKCWNFFGGPSVGSKNRDLCHVQLHPTRFEPTAEYRIWPVASNLYSWSLSRSMVSFASRSTLSYPSMPQWLVIQQERTCVPVALNNQCRFIIWQITGFSVSSPSITCKHNIESESATTSWWAGPMCW